MNSIFEEVQIAIHGIWSRRWIALAIAWGVAMVGWLAVSLIPNSYVSRARVYVEPQSLLVSSAGSTPLVQQQEIDQIRQTLTSVDNLQDVVRGTDLGKTARTPAEIGGKVGMLKKNITILSQQDNLFEISAVSSDSSLSDRANAVVAGQVVAKLIDILGQENLGGRDDDSRRMLKILDGQIAERAKELQGAEQKRVNFEQRNVGLLPGAGSIAQRMDAARSEMNQIDAQMMAAQGALGAVNSQLAATPPTIDSMAAGGSGQGGSALSQAMGELAAARARGWTDNHPDVVALNRQIAALRAMGGGGGGGGVTRSPNPAYVQLRSLQAERAATVNALQARKAELQASLSGMAAKQVQEPGLAAEQDRLDRDYAAIKDQYDKLVADREQARLRTEVRSEAGTFNVRVIDPPSVPSAPASPNRPLLLVAVLVAAIGAGVGGAFVLGQLRTTYATAARLERDTGLPVIGSVTETLGSIAHEMRRRKLRLFAGACAGLVLMCAALEILELVERGMGA